MGADNDFRAGEALALEWIEGRTSLTDDLADLVLGMARELSGEAREFGGDARGFLVTIGNAARMARKSKARPTPAGAPAPAGMDAQMAPQPTPEPPQPRVDLNELMRRRREREYKAKLDELGRRNQQAWLEQHAMIDATRRF
jgi:hypothetical protein